MKTMLPLALAKQMIVFSCMLLISGYAFSQWVFVARHAIGRIEQITQNQSSGNQPATEVATVILDAPAQKVFDVAVNTIQQNGNVKISALNEQKLSLTITQGDRTATLAINPLSDDTSQLMVVGTASPGNSPHTSQIVDGVIRLCNQLGKDCKLGSN
jgi:ABC-type branched-subunit amino acid transport system substrate-binding protein